MDHVLEYSQEGPVNGPNVNEEEKEATWTSRGRVLLDSSLELRYG